MGQKNKILTVGSLFSGIGGLDLGLEWAGFETAWFCEIEPFPQQVLEKHWPGVPIYNDVREITAGNVRPVDVIAGGFPCQDISWAGRGRGIDYDLSEQEGTRSGLWWEMWRVIRDLRPRYVIAENVPALTHRGLDIVLGSLAQIGYDAEWQTISAASVGAPHIRERVFIVAYPRGDESKRNGGFGELAGAASSHEGAGRKRQWIRDAARNCRKDVAYPTGERAGRGPGVIQEANGGSGERIRESVKPSAAYVAHAEGPRLQGRGEQRGPGRRFGAGRLEAEQPDWFAGPIGQHWPVSFRGDGVEVEYDFCGMAYGVSDRVGQLKGYGNAVVPQVAYLIGRAVMEHANQMRTKNELR